MMKLDLKDSDSDYAVDVRDPTVVVGISNNNRPGPNHNEQPDLQNVSDMIGARRNQIWAHFCQWPGWPRRTTH